MMTRKKIERVEAVFRPSLGFKFRIDVLIRNDFFKIYEIYGALVDREGDIHPAAGVCDNAKFGEGHKITVWAPYCCPDMPPARWDSGKGKWVKKEKGQDNGD